MGPHFQPGFNLPQTHCNKYKEAEQALKKRGNIIIPKVLFVR